MPVAFFYFLNLILISRLVFAFRDVPITRTRLAVMLGVQIIGLLVLQMRLPLLILALLLVGLGMLIYFLERKKRHLNEIRLLSLLVYLLVGSVFFSAWVGLGFSQGLASFSQSWGKYTVLLGGDGKIEWLRLHLVFFGLLLVTNESNMLIRFLLQTLSLAPRREEMADEKILLPVDHREFNAGRVIGILERVLIYYFVLNAQFAAIGFILAAKSFTRFRELEKREFAEYVLIGTLLSALLAMLGAGLVQVLLP
jgi:hypothetical protein